MSDGIDINTAYAIIIPTCILGLIYAFYNYIMVRKVDIMSTSTTDR